MAVLAKSEIEKRLGRGEVFRPKSWAEDCIRGAGYDLRIAADYLIAPDGTRYWPGRSDGRTKCLDNILLKPGEVAFVSSVEELCMPLDLAGNIAPKFRLARRGLLVMGGLLVDPGYGLERQPDGSWEASANGARLHFQLANIGAEDLVLLPEKDTIAGIQLLPLNGKVKGRVEKWEEISVPNSEELLESMFERGRDEPLAPLDFFFRARKLEEAVSDLQVSAKKHEQKLEVTRLASDQLVVFGVFLIAITLFTVAVAALVSALAEGHIDDFAGTGTSIDFTLAGLLVAIGLVGMVGFVAWKIMQPAIAAAERVRGKEKAQAAFEDSSNKESTP